MPASSPDSHPGADARRTPAPAEISLPKDEVHVWHVRLDDFRAELWTLAGTLSADEAGRAGRFHFTADREHFIVARAVLRILLGRYLDRPPAALSFAYSPHGKPELAAAADGSAMSLHFNLAHSHGLAVYAVTRGRRIGVDVEFIRPGLAADRIAEHFFSAHEIATLRALPIEMQEAAFFRCWTRKEAFIKAHGAGLSFPLDRFDVSLAPGDPTALLSIQGLPGEAQRWALCDLPVYAGFVGALAVEGQDWLVRHWEADRNFSMSISAPSASSRPV